MPTCYLCGQSIRSLAAGFRRKVRTGEYVYRSRSKAVRTSYGLRVLCSRCAKRIDAQDLRQEFLWLPRHPLHPEPSCTAPLTI